MKVITNKKSIAIEILSAQDLFNSDIDEITIKSISNHKHGLNDYDALIKIKGLEFILYRDFNFQNVKIKDLLDANLNNIEFIEL